jgi:hydroxymethylbilane synthase
VQTRDDPALLQTLAPIHHVHIALAVTAERAFLAGLGGGCSVPVAAYADWEDGRLILHGRICSPDGTQRIDVNATADVQDRHAAHDLGMILAYDALEKGAKALMEQRP